MESELGMNKMHKYDLIALLICILICCRGSQVAVAQDTTLDPANSASSMTRSAFEIEDGGQNWELFLSRKIIQALAFSHDGATLWVGTQGGGLEERDAITGELRRVLTRQEGLPSNNISALESDENGLWIGTHYGGGLVHMRSNGAFTRYDSENSEFPGRFGESGNVRCLLSDNQGGIWIGTRNGLAHLKSDGSWEVFNEDNSDLPDDSISALQPDGAGGIWIGVFGDALVHLTAENRWEIFTEENSDLPSDGITELLADGKGGVWIGTSYDGLGHFDGQEIWHTNATYDDITSLVLDGDWGVWIGGSGGEGLVYVNGDWENWDETPFNSKSVFSDWSKATVRSVYALLPDGNGGVWAGTWNGLAHLDSEGQWRYFADTVLGLMNSDTNALLPDGHGGVWVGSKPMSHLQANGMWEIPFFDETSPGYSVDYGKWTFLDEMTPGEGLNSNTLWAFDLISDGDEGLWIVTPDLLHMESNGNWETFTDLPSSIEGFEIMLSDGNGGFWLGGTFLNGKGLAHLMSNGLWELFDEANSDLPDDDIQALVSDETGGLWIGTRKGLANLRNDGSWEVFDQYNSILLDGWINSLVSDGYGGLWIGTGDTGLVHLASNGTWKGVLDTDTSELPSNYVAALYPGNMGDLWIGTSKGLYQYKKGGSGELFQARNSPLPLDDINDICGDGKGGLWIGTDGGGLAHLILTGSPEAVSRIDSPDIMLDWFLNSAPLTYQRLHHIELQWSFIKEGPYEAVYDIAGNPVRFHADYLDCFDPINDNCHPEVEGHTSATKRMGGDSGEMEIKGYTLDSPIVDPAWRDGTPRYYRLSTVIEKEGTLVRMDNTHEAALISPGSKTTPSLHVRIDRDFITMEEWVSLSWSEMADAEGFTLFYAPLIDMDDIRQIDMGMDTQIVFDGSGLGFYVAVQAYNSMGRSELSNIESFDLRYFNPHFQW